MFARQLTGTRYTQYLAHCLDVEPRQDAHLGKQLCSLYLLNLVLSCPPENGCSLHVSAREQETVEATFKRKKMKQLGTRCSLEAKLPLKASPLLLV